MLVNCPILIKRRSMGHLKINCGYLFDIYQLFRNDIKYSKLMIYIAEIDFIRFDQYNSKTNNRIPCK